jgi:3',5'-cyclic AMP phosphodiesterase CpdA
MSQRYKRLLVISDPHVWSSEANARTAVARVPKPNTLGVFGTFGRAHELERVCSRMAERFNPQNYIVLITGDVVEGGNTDRTRDMEYQNAEAALQPLLRRGFDVHMVPGNHDVGPAGIAYNSAAHQKYEEFHERICGYRTSFPHTVDYGDWELLLLNSTAGRGSGQALASRGQIGAQHLAWLRDRLPDSKPVVIAMHHHPDTRKMLDQVLLAVTDSEALMAILGRPRRHFLTVCCGHLHTEQLSFLSSGKLRGVASGKCTNVPRVLSIDPVTQSVEGMNLFLPSEIKTMLQRTSQQVRRQVTRTTGQVTNAAGQVTSTARETAGQVTNTARETAGQVTNAARETAGQVTNTPRDTASGVFNAGRKLLRRK